MSFAIRLRAGEGEAHSARLSPRE